MSKTFTISSSQSQLYVNESSPNLRRINLNERISKTQKIWYLPHLSKNSVINLLIDKPIGNFILSGECEEVNHLKYTNDFSAEISSKIISNSLTIFSSNGQSSIRQTPIDIDYQCFYFYLNGETNTRFRNIIDLLEYLLDEKNTSRKLKLTLPIVIQNTSSLNFLNSLSLLEQDFWLSNFYFKYSPTSSLWPVINSENSCELNHDIIQRTSQKQLTIETNRFCHQNRDQTYTDLRSDQSNVKKSIFFKSVENALQNFNTTSKATKKTSDAATLSSEKEHKKLFFDKIKKKLKPNSKNNNGKFKGKNEFLIKFKRKTSPSKRLERFQYDPRFSNLSQSGFGSNSSSADSRDSSISTNKQIKRNRFFNFQWPRKCVYLSGISKVNSNSNLEVENKVNCITIDNLQKSKTKSPSIFKSNALTALLNLFKNTNKINKKSNKENALKYFQQDLIQKETNLIKDKNSTKIFLQNQSVSKLIRKRSSRNLPKFSDSTFLDNSNFGFLYKEKEEAMVNLSEINRSNSINFTPSPSSSSMKISALAAAILTPKFRKFSKEKTSISKSTSTYEDGFQNSTSQFPGLPPTHKPPPPINHNLNLSFCYNSHTDKKNNNLTFNKFRSSNEYSEPFDLLVQSQETRKVEKDQAINSEAQDESQKENSTKKPTIHLAYSHNNYSPCSPKLIRPVNSTSGIASSISCSNSNGYFQLQSKSLNVKLKYPKDDDSAYSSCCTNTQSNVSTPKISNKKFTQNSQINKSDHCDIEEDTLTLDSSTVLSTSSSSSSPIPSLAKNSTILLTKSPRYDFLNSPSYSCSQKMSSAKLTLFPEYESVKDTIIPDQEKNQKIDEKSVVNESPSEENESHMFKSTISAFDVLTERCTELIDLFDEETQKKSESPFQNVEPVFKNMIEYTEEACDQVMVHDKIFRYLNSVFLERTLTFNTSVVSSALLSSSRSSFLFSGNTSEILENEMKKTETNSIEKDSIKKFIFKMAQDERSLFGRSLSEFINCTSKSKEVNPNILMSNTRQFMDGIKNYLLKNESELKLLIEKERSSLEQMRILNIDSIVEDCLQSIILRPLKSKIYYLLVDWLIGDSSIILMSKNIKKLNSLTEDECVKYLGLRTKVNQKPCDQTLKQIRTFFSKMQCEYSPLIKLKYLLFIINELLVSIEDFAGALKDLANLNLVDFMPVVIYSLCRCNMYSLQIELDYIWSLSNRKLLTNETIYYLTLMSSACYVIKNLEPSKLIEMHSDVCQRSQRESILTLENNRKSIKISSNVDFTKPFSYLSSGTMDIFITDERFQTIKMQTIPIKPNSNTRDVCSLIAAKFRIFNCNDYNLCYVENGMEKVLRDDEQSLELKNDKIKHGSNVIFIYKQKNINILWPKI